MSEFAAQDGFDAVPDMRRGSFVLTTAEGSQLSIDHEMIRIRRYSVGEGKFDHLICLDGQGGFYAVLPDGEDGIRVLEELELGGVPVLAGHQPDQRTTAMLAELATAQILLSEEA